MNPLNDPDILALPHPVRVDAALGEPLEVGALRALGLLEGLKPYLGDTRVTTEWLLNRVPGMAEAAIASMGAPGSFNLGAFLLLLARASTLTRKAPSSANERDPPPVGKGLR